MGVRVGAFYCRREVACLLAAGGPLKFPRKICGLLWRLRTSGFGEMPRRTNLGTVFRPKHRKGLVCGAPGKYSRIRPISENPGDLEHAHRPSARRSCSHGCCVSGCKSAAIYQLEIFSHTDRLLDVTRQTRYSEHSGGKSSRSTYTNTTEPSRPCPPGRGSLVDGDRR